MENEQCFLRTLMVIPPSGWNQLAYDSQLRAPSQLLKMKILTQHGERI